ncbi:sodium-translocating pyrophosphatase [Bryobacter aggregatus]|uniref:sodium-translocating pyrophosphatase n=1 Tax=Bryobacter aggregatus TaxID=360054 RepID=UPI0009B5B669|nr:sodium-translocating pyrophosphatase [Bryobacter aggregatus]
MYLSAASGQSILVSILGISAFGMIVALYLARFVLAKDTGTPEMRKISDAIKEGAEAYMSRQNVTIAGLSILLAVIIYVSYLVGKGDTQLAVRMTISFLFGAMCSLAAGFSGMWVSIRANIRVAAAARSSLGEAMQIALRGGAVTGIAVTALSTFGVTLLFAFFDGLTRPQDVPGQIVAFGFGASFVALFAQLGGGIYTKAADVGADLVGKMEAGIPEDDPRNPAVIADLVGDNVGDCAGRGADIFESTAAENIGAMILGVTLYKVFGLSGILFPLYTCALGLIASIVGVFTVRLKGNEDPMRALNRGFYVTSAIAIGGFYLAIRQLLGGNLWLFGAGVVGILTSFLFVFLTQYYTDHTHRPVRFIAESCTTGPATAIITGLAVGMECTGLVVLTITAAIFTSYWMGMQAALPGVTLLSSGLYGTAIATMGVLSTAAYVLAMDTFGPITDNAGGIVEMSKQAPEVRHRTDLLDAAGNTTKALTKGYAIGSAALAAFLLFSAYIDEVKLVLAKRLGKEFDQIPFSVDIGQVPVFLGALLGAMLVFVFSSLAIQAVGRVAQTVIWEVRRQFQENPGILAGTSLPNYRQCVDIVTRGALRAMIVPGALPVLAPIVVGLLFKQLPPAADGTPMGACAVAALLMVGTITGILMASFMNNGGGAWDNAKKYIELGHYGGKGSDAHKASVVGDTVGDPFKDTAGPSIHVLIKLLATITLVAAPLFI